MGNQKVGVVCGQLVLLALGLSKVCMGEAIVYSISPTTDEASIDDGGVVVLESSEVTLSIVAKDLHSSQKVRFTKTPGSYGDICSDYSSEPFALSGLATLHSSTDVQKATVTVELEKNLSDRKWYYLCLLSDSSASNPPTNSSTTPSNPVYLHQGNFARINVKARLMPLWLQILLICVLFCISGLFSGLTLGLMSLDPTELIIVQKSGTTSEKKYAKAIAPIRKRGNFLLCSLIIGNVLVNSTLTVLLEDVGGGIVALVCSTVGIVVFGEILPQAICSRYGLAIGARTLLVTKLFMILTFPISFPLSIVLDKLLGEELGVVYSRERLAELIRLGADKDDIKTDELNIIQGALQLTKKTAVDVMTKIDDVYMVNYDAVLDFETMSDILQNGYTRVPVYESNRLNVVALLNIKDLAFIDADDNLPLKTVCKFYNHHIAFVSADTPLDKLLEDFKQGHSHIAFVRKLPDEEQGGGDIASPPNQKVIGIVTLEDIIEEIMQCEIMDESDIVTDNQTRRKRQNNHVLRRDFTVFNIAIDDEGRHEKVPPQLALACYQFLQTSVEPFKEAYISASILRRLLKQNIYIKQMYHSAMEARAHPLYKRGEPADYFVIIVQGRCSVEVGNFNMNFEAGPFFTFGSEALVPEAHRYQLSSSSSTSKLERLVSGQATFVPDFTVVPLEALEYIKVTKRHYVAARRATLLEQQQCNNDKEAGASDDIFIREWNKASDEHPANRSAAIESGLLRAPPLNRTDNVAYDCDPYVPSPDAAGVVSPTLEHSGAAADDNDEESKIEKATEHSALIAGEKDQAD